MVRRKHSRVREQQVQRPGAGFSVCWKASEEAGAAGMEMQTRTETQLQGRGKRGPRPVALARLRPSG